ncbi:MAG TPA: NrfD/PsrC family molybdoenzyme membrane anchor subunit [Thermoanaerobaculia bacterium]|nr:NrfD/PsrC family molybdoenzyme membrane anchor subunit [Thermoanaerobaculia bacterium]
MSLSLSLRPVWVTGNPSLGQITEDVCRPLSARPTGAWFACFAVALAALGAGVAAAGYEIATGIGTWGLNKSVGWAFDITNFVFWIGIGHAGTLISAILMLFRQKWRTSISRSAEGMTIFAVMCAGLFPLIHMGRPWFAFWVMPYPNSRGPLWVNFRSPLLWDVVAISTYFTISFVFWYVGMIPDLATLRDRTRPGWRRKIYALVSLGWDGSRRTWSRYETMSLILAGLATPLVVSVHSVVSMDFATSVIPGWHTTLFPPYFVAGAIFSGFGMVTTLLILTRKVMALERYITLRHLEAMAKILLLTGSMVGFSYLTEIFVAWYGGNPYERAAFWNRATGPYAWAFWTMMTCNLIVPQFLWSRRLRTSVPVLFVLSLLVNVGMWFERFVIIVTSLHRDFLPSSWTMYKPTIVEIGILIGSFGLFFTLFLLFVRTLPIIAMWEIKAVAAGEARHE